LFDAHAQEESALEFLDELISPKLSVGYSVVKIAQS